MPPATAVAEDLRRFHNGEPILAKPATLWQHTIKWIRRRPVVTMLLAVAMMLFATLLAGSWWYTITLAESNTKLKAARDLAVANEIEANRAWNEEKKQRQRAVEKEKEANEAWNKEKNSAPAGCGSQ